MKPSSRSRAGFILVLSAALVAASAARGEDDDWAAELGAREADETSQTGVIGMSAQEFETYTEKEEIEGEGDEETPEVFIRNRRRVVVREMKFNTDWDCDPTAVPAMINQFKRLPGMDAQALIPLKPLTFDSPELFDYPFVYMTAHYAFKFSDEEAAGLRRYVERGGDGKKMLYDSEDMTYFTDPKEIDIDVSDSILLMLVTGDSGDGNKNDIADWADARLELK